MGLLDRIFKRKAPPLPKETYYTYSTTLSPRLVSVDRALQNSTAQSCISLISKSIALLPLNLYTKGEKGREKAEYHSLYNLLRYEPNNDETSESFIERIVRDLLVYGNAFIYKSYSSSYSYDGLFVLPAKCMKVERNDLNQKVFTYESETKTVTYTSREVLHIPGMAYDGTKGYSLLDYAKNAITLGVTIDEYTENAFTNTVNSKLVVDISGMSLPQTKETQQKLADYIQGQYSGSYNNGKPFVTFGGMKVEPIGSSTSNKDADLTASREITAKEIARIFNVPLFLLGDFSDFKYQDTESAMSHFLTFTLQPWMNRIVSFMTKLLRFDERGTLYLEFDPNPLLRVNTTARIDAYSKLFNIGAVTVNEVREKENMKALEAGDSSFVPVNLMPLTPENLSAYMSKQKIALQNDPLIGLNQQ